MKARLAIATATAVLFAVLSQGLGSVSVLAAPPNDNLASAEAVDLGTNYNGSNVSATVEAGETTTSPCFGVAATASVWYTYTGVLTGVLTIDTNGSQLSDTTLVMYSGPAVSPTHGSLTYLACDDDSGDGNLSRLSQFVSAGTTYYFRVAGYGSTSGSLRFRLGVTPANDNLSGAINAASFPATFSPNNAVATLETGEEALSFCGGTLKSTVWYKFQTPLASNYAVEIKSYTVHTRVAVFSSPSSFPAIGSLNGLICAYDPSSNDVTVGFNTNSTDWYFVQVGTWNNDFPTGFQDISVRIDTDVDSDLILSSFDNCSATPNGPVQTLVLGVGNQADNDADGPLGYEPPAGGTIGGDACDADDDNDGKPDTTDGCRTIAEDYDGFEDGDGCADVDNDGDGVCDSGQISVSCTGSDSGKFCFDPAATLSCAVAPPGDCRNIAEDYDGFKDSDGCPEPDNDNDGATDAVDQCSGLDWQAGPDGMFGSPQDLNHNGIKDVSEATLTSDDLAFVVEDHDGVLDADGCHDSPGADYDGDGFTDDAEALTIGTNAGYPCGYNSWPADLWDQPPLSANKITVQDLTSFIAPLRRLSTSPGDANFSTRWDLLPGKGIFSNTINVQDMTALVTLAPPILNGARALNGPTCPLPSQ